MTVETVASPRLLAGFNLIAQTDSSNYFESQANGMTYLEAQDFCLSKGGRLATFESAAENALVQGSAVGHIGLWKNNGTWKWITGPALDYASWSPADIDNPSTDVAAVLVAGGWDRASQMTPSSAICEMEALGELSASGDAYMVPTATNTFPIYYESNSTFELPTVLLLDSAGLDNMNGPAHFGEQDCILASQTKRRTPAWEVPVLIVPDPLDLNQLRDAEYGMYTSIASTGGTLDDVQLNPATYNLGEIELSSLWTTLTVEENGTNLVTVDASVSPDSLGLTPTDNLLSEYDAGKFYITPPDEDLALWRAGSDVKVFNANTLKTTIELSPTNDFNDHELHIAFPITAPKFDPETLSDLSYSGADAVNNALPYWGVPNGVGAYAEMYVRVRNELTGAYFYTTLTTTENPLLL